MNIINRDKVFGRGMQIATRPRTKWGWGLQNNRLNDTGKFSSFNLRRLVFKQILRNNNLGSFLKYWKGQKREIVSTTFLSYFKIMSKVIKGAINERGKNFNRDRTQVGGRYSKGKRLVSKILGFRSWCWSLNPTTIH